MKIRIQILSACMFLFTLFLLFKGAQIQFFPDQRLISTKKRIFEKVVTIKPRRGAIYDRYGRELALSVSSYSLFADPSLIKHSREVSQKIEKLLKIPKNKVFKKIRNKKRRFVWIKRHVSEKERTALKSWMAQGLGQGLGFIEEPKRIYPNGTLLAQVLGFTGIDGHGLEGLELFYDGILSGQEQKIITPRDARGRPLFIDGGTALSQSKGSDIYLTIDSDLQFVVERELQLAIDKFKASSAMGIIMDARSSEILAMAHFPTFNPNQPFKYNPSLYRNRVVTDAFEPGSTFKTFIVASALKEGIPPHTKYDGKGGEFKIGGHTIHEAEADHKYDKISLSEILSFSSNIGSAVLALSLRDQTLYTHLKEFGFGEKLQAEFPLEGKGVLQNPPWKNIMTGTIGFGQGVSSTPLQMTAAYTSIANGGLLKTPRILGYTVDLSGQEKKPPPPSLTRKVLTEEQANALTLMLTQATSKKGTGFQARIPGFLTAGKTGTAQKPDLKKGGYIPGEYISSFIGFVPSNKPQFVIYVAIDSPQNLFYGSVVAAPVFSSIGHYAVRRTGLSPSFIEEPFILEKKKWVETKNDTPKTVNKNTEKTPNFRGLSLREALQKAKNTNIRLQIKGSGTVQSSSPFPGETLPKDRKVLIQLGQK